MGLTRITAGQISNIDYKQAVRVITLSNITLSGGAPTVVDGVTLVLADRILVAGQGTASQNGLYYVTTLGTGANGTWSRTIDAVATGEVDAGMIVMVTEGNTYKDSQWKLTTNNPIVIGTTGLTFEQNSAYAFGNIYANSTAVVATTVGDTLTLTPGTNIQITGNISAKSVTIGVTGISLTSISSGTSNVNVVSSGGNVTVGVGGTSNVAVFSSSGANIAGTLGVTGNITGGNLQGTTVSGTTGAFTGNVTTGNVSGTIGAFTNVGGTLTTAAQTNITSVGTLTSLAVTGNITSGNVSGTAVSGTTGTFSGNVNAGNLSGTSIVGTLTTAAQTNITSVGTLTALTLSGNVNMGSKNINNLLDPVSNQDAATKYYVDLVAQGLHIHTSAYVATTGNLATATGGTITYNNGASGVGANLVTTGTYLLIDGGNVQTVGTRILVKNEANTTWNGVYTYSNTTVIVRATDFDNPVKVAGGDFLFVTSGTTQADTGWVQTTDAPITFGTSAIVFAQFSGAGTYQAGTGLTLTGQVFSVNASQTQITTVGTLGSLAVTGNITSGNLQGTSIVGTLTTAAQTNITSVGTLGSLAVTGNITSGNVSGITGTFTNVGGTLTTAAQTNITSVGTLTSLAVTGNITSGNLQGTTHSGTTGTFSGNVTTGNVSGTTGTFTNVGGTLTTAAQTNITSVGTLTSLAVTGNITSGNLQGTSIVGTLTTAAQTNITSVGTLTSLAVTGNITSGNVSGTTVSGTTGTFSGNVTTGNVSGTTGTFTNVGGTLTTAAQTNITSVGTLSSLAVTGNITSGNVSGTTVSGTTGTFSGNVNTANVAATSTISSVTVIASGNVTGGNLITSGLISVTGNVNIGNATGVTWANTSGARAWTYYNNATASLDTVFL